MTNFEKLKNEINIYDFADYRLTFDKHRRCISNDVCPVGYDGDGECKASALKAAFDMELKWLESEAKDDD